MSNPEDFGTVYWMYFNFNGHGCAFAHPTWLHDHGALNIQIGVVALLYYVTLKYAARTLRLPQEFMVRGAYPILMNENYRI